jgi:hypothetical protein
LTGETETGRAEVGKTVLLREYFDAPRVASSREEAA